MFFVILFFILTSFSFAEYGSSSFLGTGPKGQSYDISYTLCSETNRTQKRYVVHEYGVGNVNVDVSMTPIDIFIDGQKQHNYFADEDFKRAKVRAYICSYYLDGRMYYKFIKKMSHLLFGDHITNLKKHEYETIKSEGKIMLRRTRHDNPRWSDDECVGVGNLYTPSRRSIRNGFKRETICMDENHYAFTSRLWNSLTNFLTSGRIGSECDEELPPISPLTTEEKEVKRENPRPPSQPDTSKPTVGTIEKEIKEKLGVPF